MKPYVHPVITSDCTIQSGTLNLYEYNSISDLVIWERKDEMIKKNSPSLFPEPDEMRDSAIPPRTAEELWELAKERKKNNGSGKKRMRNEATRNDLIADEIRPQVPEQPEKLPGTGMAPDL